MSAMASFHSSYSAIRVTLDWCLEQAGGIPSFIVLMLLKDQVILKQSHIVFHTTSQGWESAMPYIGSGFFWADKWIRRKSSLTNRITHTCGQRIQQRYISFHVVPECLSLGAWQWAVGFRLWLDDDKGEVENIFAEGCWLLHDFFTEPLYNFYSKHWLVVIIIHNTLCEL